jgi:hypothetical protein
VARVTAHATHFVSASSMDRDELAEQIEGLNDEYVRMMRAMGAHEPDWGPLEKVLPLKWCGGFMFMGYSGRIRIYKHGLTRNYLHVDDRGKTYAYDGGSEEYFEIPKKMAVDLAFKGIEEMGYTRKTKCTPQVMAERRRRMQEAGYKIVVLGPDGSEN